MIRVILILTLNFLSENKIVQWNILFQKIEHDECIGGLNRCDVVEYSLESQCDVLNEDGVERSNYQVVSGICTLGHPTTYSSLSNFEKPLPEGSNTVRKSFAAWVR